MKIAGLVLGIILLAVLGSAAFIQFSGIPYYEKSTIGYQVISDTSTLERGEKLAGMLCAGCHMNRETGQLTGQQMLDAPPEFGMVYAPNITQDKTHGIGEWTNGELLYLLRTGIKRDGQYAPAYMAKLPLMADEDLNAIIAFLRSDHPLVAAAAVPDKPSEPSFLTKVLSRVVWKPYAMPTAIIPSPDTSNTVELGEYLAHNLDCYACHSADFKSINPLDPPTSIGYFGGGNKPLDLEGRVMLTSNITPDKETGIGNWTREEFIKALKYGLKEGEPALSYPMMPYTQLTDHEAGAIYDYLMTIPPIANKVERSVY